MADVAEQKFGEAASWEGGAKRNVTDLFCMTGCSAPGDARGLYNCVHNYTPLPVMDVA